MPDSRGGKPAPRTDAAPPTAFPKHKCPKFEMPLDGQDMPTSERTVLLTGSASTPAARRMKKKNRFPPLPVPPISSGHSRFFMTFFGNSYRALRALPWVVASTAAALYTLAMPGPGFAEAAWLWAVPFLLWATSKPSWKTYLRTAFLTMWVAKIATLVWLRHVYPPMGWLGLVLLTATVAAFPAAWLSLVRWLFPKTDGAPLMSRLVIQLGLAGTWVFLEWVQTWLFTGFPWALLAETQWLRPSVLALCPWGGPWAPGFAIILFNIGIARYVRRYLHERELAEEERLKSLREPAPRHSLSSPLPSAGFPSPLGVFRKLCPEFYLGATPIFLSAFLFLQNLRYEHENSQTLFTAAVIQTDFDPNQKLNEFHAKKHVDIVRSLTQAASRLTKENPVFEWSENTPLPAATTTDGGKPRSTPNLIFWPETALPFHIGNESFDQFLKQLAADAGATLFIGADTSEKGKGYYNGIFTVTGANGPNREEFYAKRHRVPFGEYIPEPVKWLGLRTVIPISQDCLIGTRDDPLPVPIPRTAFGYTPLKAPGPEGSWITPIPEDGGFTTLKGGALVCYEDVFPELGLDMARRGADFLAVLSNDAWYGREAGAYQHAAHSAVLAASLRLPVVRCSNNGWSGVINSIGQVQPFVNAAGSIYFRGAGRFEVRGVRALIRVPTFYVQRGDWLVLASGLLALWAILRNRRWRKTGTATPARRKILSS